MTSCRYIWSEPCIPLIYCTQLHSVWSLLLFSEIAYLPEVSMNIWTAKVCVPYWFAILSSKFPAEHLFLLLEWFTSTPFLSPLILLQSILVSSFYLSVNIVVLYSHLYWNLKREVSWSDKEFKIVIFFWGRSREDSLFQAFYYLNAWNRLQRRKEWICESRCQVSDHLHFLRNILI